MSVINANEHTGEVVQGTHMHVTFSARDSTAHKDCRHFGFITYSFIYFSCILSVYLFI